MAKKGGAKKSDKSKTVVKKEGKKLSGDSIERKNRFCPKCGPGTFLGVHKDRLVCGKCKYVEYLNKQKEEPKEESKEVEPKKE